MESLLLTLPELISFNDTTNLSSLSPEINAKLEKASTVLKASHIIDKTKYDKVYITSDIHCDLAKLNNMLTNAKLTTIVNKPLMPGINAAKAAPVKVIDEIEWIPERTLLIIVGDIVDGRRSHGHAPNLKIHSEIPDPKGNIELLLHAYLYNLRIKAQLKNSEIRFTVGNHDYHNVIKEEENDWPEFYTHYVHATSQAFFGSRANRRSCLLPFYNCCPYIFLTVDDEIACIHGGLKSYQVEDKKGRLVNNRHTVTKIQKSIDSKHNFSGISEAAHEFLSDVQGSLGTGKESSPLWSRAYQHFPSERICPLLGDVYKMVVVGHCQMAVYSGNSCGKHGDHAGEILDRAEYTKYECGGLHGCVLGACGHLSPEGPKLAFVDIGFSRAFSPPGIDERSRRAEILELTHDPTLQPIRYYNKVVRLSVGSPGPNEKIWSAFPITKGGSKKKNKRKTRKIQRR